MGMKLEANLFTGEVKTGDSLSHCGETLIERDQSCWLGFGSIHTENGWISIEF